MDIHHLKIFFEACNEKSFTKAAKKLFISQSAVSIQIKKLEKFQADICRKRTFQDVSGCV